MNHYDNTTTATSGTNVLVVDDTTTAANYPLVSRVFAPVLLRLKKEIDRLQKLELSRNWAPAPIAITGQVQAMPLVPFNRRLSARGYTGRNFRR